MAQTSEAFAEGLDLNTASAAELEAAMPELGTRLAFWIVRHRTRSGPFVDVESLRAVKGVDGRTAERLAAYLRAEVAEAETSGLHAVEEERRAAEADAGAEPDARAVAEAEADACAEADARAAPEADAALAPEPDASAAAEADAGTEAEPTSTDWAACAELVEEAPAREVAPARARGRARALLQVGVSLVVSLVAAGGAASVAVRRESAHTLAPVVEMKSVVGDVAREQTEIRDELVKTRAVLDAHAEKIAHGERVAEGLAKRQEDLESTQRAEATRQRESEARQARVNAVLTGRLEGVEARLDDRVMSLSQALDAIDKVTGRPMPKPPTLPAAEKAKREPTPRR